MINFILKARSLSVSKTRNIFLHVTGFPSHSSSIQVAIFREATFTYNPFW